MTMDVKRTKPCSHVLNARYSNNKPLGSNAPGGAPRDMRVSTNQNINNAAYVKPIYLPACLSCPVRITELPALPGYKKYKESPEMLIT